MHQGHYNPMIQALESYLYSTKKQTVRIRNLNKDFKFNAWEGIKTEQSYKYSIEEIEFLAERNGFQIIKKLYDSREYFVDSIWEVKWVRCDLFSKKKHPQSNMFIPTKLEQLIIR